MQKTIHYRQVEWFGAQENIVNLLTSTLATRPHVNQTEFTASGETCEVRHRNVSQHEVRLHISTHRPGATKGIRSAGVGVSDADLGEAAPPQNSDFVEREIALVIREDRLGFVVSGATFAPVVERLLRQLISLEHLAEVGNRLVLASRANPEMISQLLVGGVDKLDLDLSLPLVEAHQAIEAQPVSLGHALGRSVMNAISARFEADLDHAALANLVNANARLQIDVGRKPTLEEVEDLTVLATDAVNSGDEFSIRTRDKKTFTRDKLLLKSQYTQPGQGSTLNYQLAWDLASQFLDTVE